MLGLTCLTLLAFAGSPWVRLFCQRCRKLRDSEGGVPAIVTGMRECVGNRFVQEKGLELIADTCMTLASCAEVSDTKRYLSTCWIYVRSNTLCSVEPFLALLRIHPRLV